MFAAAKQMLSLDNCITKNSSYHNLIGLYIYLKSFQNSILHSCGLALPWDGFREGVEYRERLSWFMHSTQHG